jgi:ATP/maltotriose-dependent transcriptional regulator MalT
VTSGHGASEDPVAAGREALARGAWEDARESFRRALEREPSGAAWEGLSWAAWWLGDAAETLDARERAYRAHRRAGDGCGAARMALWVGSDHLDFRGDDAVAAAWLRRARALGRAHEPCSEQGYILLLEADLAYQGADPLGAIRLAEEAVAVARRIGDPGVETVGLAIAGSALVGCGRVEEGLRRLEDCAALAVGEEFEQAVAPGWALCKTVSACASVGDFERAAQWCRAMHTWSATWRARHFFGNCRTAYGSVLTARGDWRSAEQELESAVADLRASRPAMAGTSAVRLGELRLRQGELEAARALFESALPLPAAVLALGELELAQGDAVAAADAAERVLRRLGDASALERLPALELLARARAALGEADAAAAAAGEVERTAERLGTPYMRARGRLAGASVLLAAGNHEGARRAAEDAVDLFTHCSAPYDAARARLELSRALAGLGRADRAAAEEAAARDAMAVLGARPPGVEAAELSPREVDILRLVAQGHTDARIAERLFLSPHTVHRHVANIRAKLRTPSRSAAVALATREGML